MFNIVGMVSKKFKTLWGYVQCLCIDKIITQILNNNKNTTLNIIPCFSNIRNNLPLATSKEFSYNFNPLENFFFLVL